MSTQVNNLLDMARIESGDVRLRREWHSVEEIVGSAVRATRASLAPRARDDRRCRPTCRWSSATPC